MNVSSDRVQFDAATSVLILGAGACGLVAGLAAAEQGAEVLIVERDRTPSGSTAMSSGFIPAPGTKAQRALGIGDCPELFAADLQAKSKWLGEPALVELAARAIGPVLDWLEARHGFEWQVLQDFLYPGHSRHRMHTLAEKTGAALIARLLDAAGAAGIPILTEAQATELHTVDSRIAGATLLRPNGVQERVGCDAMILACNGYGGNSALVAKHIPEMQRAPYYGHPGNTGDAVIWGEALDADMRCLSACQGHGSLATPHNILISWALMMEGGVQVNADGQRFSNERQGYSEQALDVLAQPGSIAWCVFDQRLRDLARNFPDFRQAEDAGAVLFARDADDLAEMIGAPTSAMKQTLESCVRCQSGEVECLFGRDFTGNPPLSPPYYAVKVTGALFHTQGGLMIGEDARVLRRDGTAFVNLFAGGGAACGVSGPHLSGYLSGNGLLTALAFGRLAGHHAGLLVKSAS